MKLIAMMVFGAASIVTMPVTLLSANEVTNLVLTDTALVQLHSELNQCEAEAMESGLPDYGRCSDVQNMLVSHYSNYDEYQNARQANQ